MILSESFARKISKTIQIKHPQQFNHSGTNHTHKYQAHNAPQMLPKFRIPLLNSIHNILYSYFAYRSQSQVFFYFKPKKK